MSDELKKVVGIALIVVATVFTFGAATGATWAMVAAWIVPTLAISGNLLLSTIKPGATASFGSSLQLSGDTTANVQLIYGEAWTGGVLRYRDVMGVNNQDLYFVIVLAGHSCDSVPAVIADKNLLTLDGSGNVTAPSQYVGVLNIRYVLGSDSQTADSTLTSVFTGKWTSNHRLRGRTYAIVKMTFDETNMTQPPQFLFKVRGRKVYDARKDSTNGGSGAHRLATESTWEWSENSILCLNDYDRGVMINGKREAGVGIPTTRFDWANVIAEANVCDEAVTLAVGGTEKRYTANGIIDTGQDHNTVRALFETSFAGDAIFSDAKWRYFAGAYRTPTLSLLPDHFIGALKHTVFTGEKDRFDAMQGRYSASAEYGQIVDYAPVRLASATVGNERFATQDFQLVNDVIAGVGTDGGARAQRVATLLLQKQAAGKRIQCTTNLYGLRAMPGETIQITHAAFGLTAQTMRVLEVQLRPVQDGDKTGLVVDLTLEAGPSSLYTWSAAETAIAASPALAQLVIPTGTPQVFWTPVLVNVSRLGNTFTKTSGTNGSWDAAVSSQEGFDSCFATWRFASTGDTMMVGLNSDPTTDNSYTSIDHAFYNDSGTLRIYESSVSIKTFGSISTSDLFKINYDGQAVRYYQNETLLWTTPRVGARLYLDSSFANSAAQVNSLGFGPMLAQNAVIEELRDDFAYATTTDFLRRWADATTTNGELSFLTGITDTPAGTAMRVGNNAGDDMRWFYDAVRLMPYDGVSEYEVGCIVRRNSGTGVLYMGLEGIANDGVTMLNVSGSNSHGSQHNFAAAGAAPGSGWTVYRGYAKGWSGSPTGAAANDSSSPGAMYTGTVYVRPVILLNYNAAAGQMDCAAVWVRRLGGALTAKNTVNTPEIDANAATEMYSDSHDFAGATDGGSGVQTQRTFTVTPGSNCTADMNGFIGGVNVLPDSANYLYWEVDHGIGVVWNSISSSGAKQQFPIASQFSLTGGTTYTFSLKTNRLLGNPVISLYLSFVSLSVVKR